MGIKHCIVNDLALALKGKYDIKFFFVSNDKNMIPADHMSTAVV
jgi:hypothetical protein